MARTPRVLDLTVLLNGNREITGFANTLQSGAPLPDGVTITPAGGGSSGGNPPLVNIALASQADYDYIRFSPLNLPKDSSPEEVTYPTSVFKFLAATLISDTIETTRGFKNEWKPPVFDLTQAAEGNEVGSMVSRMAIFLDDDLDAHLHEFSIIYWSCLGSNPETGSIKVWDPGITNEEN